MFKLNSKMNLQNMYNFTLQIKLSVTWRVHITSISLTLS